MVKMMSVCSMGAVAAAGCCSCDRAAKDFGTTKYGEAAHLYVLEGKGGLKMEVTDYGGRVNRLWVPDAKGELADVTIGFDSPAGWETTDSYFGAKVETLDVPDSAALGGAILAARGGLKM